MIVHNPKELEKEITKIVIYLYPKDKELQRTILNNVIDPVRVFRIISNISNIKDEDIRVDYAIVIASTIAQACKVGSGGFNRKDIELAADHIRSQSIVSLIVLTLMSYITIEERSTENG
jgi:hypothetical protein